MFEKILLPLDGSNSCLRAREIAVEIAKKYDSKITAIHVMSHDFMHPELKANFNLPPLILAELDKAYRLNGKKMLKNARDFFDENNILINTVLTRAQDTADRILREAKDLECDTIIMGNISEKEGLRYSLGSIAEKVALHAKCSVLIAKKQTSMEKFLVAFDSSEQARKALKVAVDLCKHFKDSKMTILNVENGELHHLEPELAQKIGEKILDEASTTVEGVVCDRRLEFGKPADIILRTAKVNDYSLILLGSKGISRVKRFFTGSVGTFVTINAERSVMLVR